MPHVVTICQDFPMKVGKGESLHFCLDPICPDPVWKLSKSESSEGFDSSIVLVSRGGIPRSTGSFPETKTQRFLVSGFSVLRIEAASGCFCYGICYAALDRVDKHALDNSKAIEHTSLSKPTLSQHSKSPHEQLSNHLHRNLKSFEEHIQNDVSSCYVTD